MLPNHAPLMVAERFKVLEALFPGRIDLGLGHAPGTDPVTSYALRVRQDPRGGDEFLERFQELLLPAENGFPGHLFRTVRAVPADVALPPIWLLGRAAIARRSRPRAEWVSLSRIISRITMRRASCSAIAKISSHRRRLARPHAILGTAAIAADADAQAERIAASAELHYVRRAQGEYLPLESPEAAAPQAITNGWRAIAPASRPEALIVSRTGCSPWPTQRAPTKLWSLPWCSTMRRAGIPTSYWRKPSRYHNDFPDGREGVELRAIYRPFIGHRSATDFAM